MKYIKKAPYISSPYDSDSISGYRESILYNQGLDRQLAYSKQVLYYKADEDREDRDCGVTPDLDKLGVYNAGAS